MLCHLASRIEPGHQIGFSPGAGITPLREDQSQPKEYVLDFQLGHVDKRSIRSA